MGLPKDATLIVEPFKIAILDSKLDELHTLIKLSKLPPPTYEGTKEEYGVTSKWMKEAKAHWNDRFSWREHEKKINEHPQYTTIVKGRDGTDYTIHFVGIFSENPDAIPLVLLHGWPGSFVEFLDIIPILATSKSPSFHIVVPSMPGYAFSSSPPLDQDFTFQDTAYLVNGLMVGLGLKGYIAQGGDIGSFVAKVLAAGFSSCRGCHINMLQVVEAPAEYPIESLDTIDRTGIERGAEFDTTGNAYALEHATRPSTIGHVLASSPLALLAWIGEKLRDWSDESPPLEKILEIVTLWWFTETMPRSIYAYRQIFIKATRNMSGTDLTGVSFGFSNFPKELFPVPETWAGSLGKLIFYKRHDKKSLLPSSADITPAEVVGEQGGHFAAMEVPELLAEDVRTYANTLVAGGGTK